MNRYYHKIDVISSMTSNHWTLVALMFFAIAIIIGMSQHKIKGRNVIERFSSTIYLALDMLVSVVMTAMLIVESHRGIIQFLDNLLRGNESPLMSLIIMPVVALLFGVIIGFVIALIGDITAYLCKRRLIKKLHLAAEARRKANPQRIRRGQPKGSPRPGTSNPTRYDAKRDKANQAHRNRNR